MRLVSILVMITLLALVVSAPVLAQTEDELVAKYLQKAEKKHLKKVGFVVISGSYGKLSDSTDYNYYANGITPWISSTDGSETRVDGIYRSKEFFAGFGMMVSRRLAATLGFTYWLKMGSSRDGDYNLSLVNMDDSTVREDFNLKSQVQVYGLSVGTDYYLMNPPGQDGLLNGLALKLNATGGYYFAEWEVWEGFTGYNLYLEQQEIVGGNLSGRTLGGTIGLSGELPVGLFNLVLEAGGKYQFLNFSKMRWYNDLNHEDVATYGVDNNRVELDLSGLRAQFGVKRYFSW